MRISPLLTTLTAIVVLALGLGAAWMVLRPAGPALTAARFGSAVITPNADGLTDIVRIDYTLARPARVSIYFLNSAGERFTFRAEKPRDSGKHSLYFAGVVDPFSLPGDSLEGTVVARVLPDGEYTWVVEAAETEKTPEAVSGPLTVSNADTVLPDVRGLGVSPATFSPNQDGIDDRTTVNLYQVKESRVHVSLVGEEGSTFAVAESPGNRLAGEAGLHQYDYDGGIDQGANPPPDGTYTVVVRSEDAVGQKVEARSRLTIVNGGMPRAEIVNGEVEFTPETPAMGQLLTFKLTVENYGAAPIRTTGPASGTVYEFDQNSNSLGAYDEAGAWRIGIDCETCIRDYPWRWALGTPDELTKIGEHYYLMPGQRVTVMGAVRITEVPPNNPLYFWAGLIHEYVEISTVNNRVDPHFIKIQSP